MKFNFDVIVIGAGHAGCEAASAAANLGSQTLLITMDMHSIAQMSCNPAVGGIAKGQIVREIDAMGGQMGIVTDLTAIQYRMLNKSKGPAMWSPRSQSDRQRFSEKWRSLLENTDNLCIWQDMANELLFEGKSVCGVRTALGAEFKAKAIVITAGTFLSGLMHCGRQQIKGMTTAAGLWASACMGLAIGAGFYTGALFGCVLIIATTALFSKLESFILARSRNINLYVEFEKTEDLTKITTCLHERNVRIYDVELSKARQNDSKYPGAIFSLKLPKKVSHAAVVTEIASIKAVRTIEEL